MAKFHFDVGWASKSDPLITDEELNVQARSGGWSGTVRSQDQGIQHELLGLRANKTEGDALICLHDIDSGNGVEAWRKSHAEYQPSLSIQAMGYMVKILTQTPAKDVDHATASLNQFERSIRAYEE